MTEPEPEPDPGFDPVRGPPLDPGPGSGADRGRGPEGRSDPRVGHEDGPSGVQVTCRTQGRATGILYAGLVTLFALVGLVLLLAGIGTSAGLAIFGALFLGMSVFNGWALLGLTADQLSFDSQTGVVHWHATLRSGDLPVSSVRAVRRDRRPAVYSFHCDDGSHVEFWLTRRGPEVEELFRVLGWANPSMATDELYQPGGFWWKGIRPPG